MSVDMEDAIGVKAAELNGLSKLQVDWKKWQEAQNTRMIESSEQLASQVRAGERAMQRAANITASATIVLALVGIVNIAMNLFAG